MLPHSYDVAGMSGVAELLPLLHRRETEAWVSSCWRMEAHKVQASVARLFGMGLVWVCFVPGPGLFHGELRAMVSTPAIKLRELQPADSLDRARGV